VASTTGFLGGLLFGSVALTAEAALDFGADPAAALWQFSGGRTECRLTHEIPNFGEARFIQEAGGSLGFGIASWRVEMTGAMDISSDTPAWSAAYPHSEPLGRIDVGHARALMIEAPLAETMLNALYRGEQPRLAGADLNLSISAVSFRPVYDTYARCVAQLLPASFKQLESSAIAFAPDVAEIDDLAKARLDLIAAYVSADDSVSRILIDGHTDSSGRERNNRVLSQRRAKAVSDYLAEAGCDPESIETRFHGSRFPMASNTTEEGRAQNRRTTIRLERRQTKLAQR